MTPLHCITRTSPMGGRFIGTCINCGREGLTLADLDKECPNTAGRTFEETVIAALEGASDE